MILGMEVPSIRRFSAKALMARKASSKRQNECRDKRGICLRWPSTSRGCSIRSPQTYLWATNSDTFISFREDHVSSTIIKNCQRKIANQTSLTESSKLAIFRMQRPDKKGASCLNMGAESSNLKLRILQKLTFG